jgi:hypothetical protein
MYIHTQTAIRKYIYILKQPHACTYHVPTQASKDSTCFQYSTPLDSIASRFCAVYDDSLKKVSSRSRNMCFYEEAGMGTTAYLLGFWQPKTCEQQVTKHVFC